MGRRPHLAPHGAGLSVVLAVLSTACGGTLDAGGDVHGPLPVDARNPIILDNDNWSDNWVGEYAVLLANHGGPRLAGIVVNRSAYWPMITANETGWTRLVAAARASGLQNIPDITVSTGAPLVRPGNGQILSTVPNDSAGARFIRDRSRELATPWRPLVVVAGASLTNVADAYLLDNTVAERVVVIASLGSLSEPNGLMDEPNGELDPWADWIVSQRFRYIQVSAFYGQTGDVSSAQVADLPQGALGAWMGDKLPSLLAAPTASDQVAILSVAIPEFVVSVRRVSPDVSATYDADQGPPLKPDPAGNVWLVTKIAAPLAPSTLWQMLLNSEQQGP